MRKTFRLTTGTPGQSFDLDFEAAAIVVNNPTGSAVFIRTGAPDIPTASNADLFVPAGQSMAYPVAGYSFAATFATVGLVSTQSVAASGLYQACVITFLDKTEAIPSYGSASFLSLSISELFTSPSGGGPFVFPVMDLGAWGGAVVFIAPAASSGQGLLKLEASTDQVTWVTVGQWAFWPAIPAILNVPRVSRYARVSTINSGIAGEPSLSYYITARASLTEITQLSYIPFTTSISRTLTVPNLGEQDFVLCTTNTPAIDVSVDVTSVGSGSAAEELICETSVNPGGPWQTASFREQNSAALTGDLFRSYGNLNAFTRIRVLEIGNGGPINGTISFSIRPAPDLSNILQLIYAALGDVGYSDNSEQDIYHTLRFIADTAILAVYNAILTGNTTLGNIQSNTSSTATNTANTASNTANTASNTANTNANVASTNTILNTTIHSDLSTINTSIGTTNTTLSTMNTNIANMAAALTRSMTPTSFTNATPAGVATSFGSVFVAGWYLTQFQVSCALAAGGGGTQIILYLGTGGGPVSAFYTCYIPTNFAGNTICMGDNIVFTSNRYAGYQIPVGNTFLYVQSSVAATTSVVVTQGP